MFRVGLTGGIGSGKSTVCRFFSELGVPVIDADQVSRELVEPGMPALAAIKEAFGDDVMGNDGQLNRPWLRDRVFADPTARAALENILHPAIRSEIERRAQALCEPYCILAIPLLFEKGWQKEVDQVVVVDTDPDNQRTRVQVRDGITREAVDAILATQASRAERLSGADDVITNEGDLADLRRQVKMVHRRLLALAQGYGNA